MSMLDTFLILPFWKLVAFITRYIPTVFFIRFWKSSISGQKPHITQYDNDDIVEAEVCVYKHGVLGATEMNRFANHWALCIKCQDNNECIVLEGLREDQTQKLCCNLETVEEEALIGTKFYLDDKFHNGISLYIWSFFPFLVSMIISLIYYSLFHYLIDPTVTYGSSILCTENPNACKLQSVMLLLKLVSSGLICIYIGYLSEICTFPFIRKLKLSRKNLTQIAEKVSLNNKMYILTMYDCQAWAVQAAKLLEEYKIVDPNSSTERTNNILAATLFKCFTTIVPFGHCMIIVPSIVKELQNLFQVLPEDAEITLNMFHDISDFILFLVFWGRCEIEFLRYFTKENIELSDRVKNHQSNEKIYQKSWFWFRVVINFARYYMMYSTFCYCLPQVDPDITFTMLSLTASRDIANIIQAVLPVLF